MKKIYYTLSFLFLLNISFAQKLLTYSDVYDLSYSTLSSGVAKYTYYEKDGYEIRQGAFSFSTISEQYNNTIEIKINGNYKNDLKNGLWTYTVIVNEYKKSKTTMILKANYKEGIPHGSWNTTLTLNHFVDKVNVNSNIITNFSNGCFVGDFKFIFNSPDENIDIYIKLDEKGFLTYDKRKKNQNIETYEFYINVKIDNKIGFENTKLIVDKINLYSNIQDSLNEIPYKLIKKQDNLPENCYDLLFSFMYFFEDIYGDINYISTGYDNSVNYKYDGFDYYILEKQTTTTEICNQYIKNGDYFYYQNNYERAIKEYEEALIYKNFEYAKNQIKICNEKIKEIEENKIKNFNNLVNEGDKYYSDYKFNEALQSYKKASEIFNDKKVKNKISKITDMKNNTDII